MPACSCLSKKKREREKDRAMETGKARMRKRAEYYDQS